MPRARKPPRLFLRKDRPSAEDRAAGVFPKSWVIRDGAKFVRTGCAESEAARAEQKLLEYLGEKHNPIHRNSPATALRIHDVLNVYSDEVAPKTARPKETDAAILRLNEFWGDMTVAEILGPTCRQFVDIRGTESGGRRDLEILRAAVKHYKAEYGMLAEPVFTLPDKSQPRFRWLTRSEVARLVWACYRSKGNDKRAHLVRFILISAYTGTRHGAVLRLQWMPNTKGGWADLEKGVLYRRPPNVRETKKRTPPIRIPDRLLAHMIRWRRLDKGILPIVHYQGEPVFRIEKSFRSAREHVKLDSTVIPHALRHTAITWLMQAGVDINEVSSFCGITIEELQRTYWHHHPDFQEGVRKVRMGNRKSSPEQAKTQKQAANGG